MELQRYGACMPAMRHIWQLSDCRQTRSTAVGSFRFGSGVALRLLHQLRCLHPSGRLDKQIMCRWKSW